VWVGGLDSRRDFYPSQRCRFRDIEVRLCVGQRGLLNCRRVVVSSNDGALTVLKRRLYVS